MAMVLAHVRKSGSTGLTNNELKKRTRGGNEIDDAISHLKKEGWVCKAKKKGHIKLTPDQSR